MALLNALPAPRLAPTPQPIQLTTTAVATVGRTATAPPYGKRKGFIPRKPSDFGDGGAYPECHVAQYPLDMGRAPASGGTSASSAIVPVSVDAEGKVDYGAIMKQGLNATKIVATTHGALVPKLHTVKDGDLDRPDEEEVAKGLAATRAIIDARVAGTIAAAQPKNIAPQPGAAQFIKYTPAKQGPEFNSGASSRVIQMHEVATDPLEPPKFRHKKVPRGPGSPPVPVMHSPPRPVSVKDQQDWKIPPCISNWKNPKGYTIPLDKRLAADGRGLQETQINDNFAKLSEALYIAENKAREAIENRTQIQRMMMSREKDRKEEELRQLAAQARSARTGGASAAPIAAAPVEERLPPPPPMGGRGYGDRPRAMDFDAGAGRDRDRDRDRDRRDDRDDERLPPPPPRRDHDGGSPPPDERESREEREARRHRDEIREERRRERERERRLEELNSHGGKRSKVTRDRDRDVSERVALGQANTGARTAEAMYDQRLFNQDQGLDSGFANDDGYNTYSKPLFADRGNANLYKPTKAGDDELYGEKDEDPNKALRTDKFRPDKGFAGAEGGTGAGGAASGPRAFEKAAHVDEFESLGKISSSREKSKGDGSRGHGSMSAAAGGGGDGGGSGRTRVDFQRQSGR